jgi:hypothetical protein
MRVEWSWLRVRSMYIDTCGFGFSSYFNTKLTTFPTASRYPPTGWKPFPLRRS